MNIPYAKQLLIDLAILLENTENNARDINKIYDNIEEAYILINKIDKALEDK